MIACHRKLGMLFLDDEIVKAFLLRELIAQAHTIIIYTETDSDVTLGRCLVQVYLHLVVVVTDGSSLTPYWLPGLIEGRCLAAGLCETIHQTGFLHALRGMLILSQLQSEMRWLAHSLSLIAHLVGRLSLFGQRESYRDVAVRRLNGLGCCQHREQEAHY